MNQQLIFNNDYQFDCDRQAVHCSVLQAGLRLDVYIRMPAGWTADSWLAQVREDAFFWEDEIEQLIRLDKTEADGSIWLDGAA